MGDGSMTIREAARLGGLACRDRHGLDHYRRLGGARPGQDRAFYVRIGRLGGAATAARYTDQASWGRRGGERTARMRS